MPRQRANGLPAVLAVPLLADRLAVELEQHAEDVATLDESPAGRERAAFITSAAAQVRQFGTEATAQQDEPAPAPTAFVPGIVGDDLETRGA